MYVIPARTVILTERIARRCRLAPADVEYLLARHRGHVELTPTGRPHVYRVTPTGHVGVIVAPTCRLMIQPKIPLLNLFFLLDPALPLPAGADSVTPADGTEVLNFLAGQLAHLLAERAAAGLHRDYAERAEQGPFLHGRLDVPAQLRDCLTQKRQLHSVHEDFTANVPCNQVPVATAELVLDSPLLRADVRELLRHALRGFAGVRSIPLGPDTFPRVAPDGYQPLLDLCRLLAEGLAPDDATGPTPAPAFLIDMERVFERHVTRGLTAAFAGGEDTVSVQPRSVVNVPSPGQPDFSMRPDLTIDHNSRPILVVDAKWIRLPPNALVTADVYQLLAYGTALGARTVVLVYPGGRERVWSYTLVDSPLRLVVRTLRVTGTRDACARAQRRLTKDIKKLFYTESERE
jgi:5-methylcytosine-specific restriction enzyme subunit McrC